MQILGMIIKRTNPEDGQALAEYALIMAFIAIVCVAALTALGIAVSGIFGSVAGSF
ncbi:MAG TPA: Flp family type IVb pilin [Dehalococcoidia bacterium]|nr:Flp family type IVb pilin [Dehalococcoidia bacterium]